MEFLQDVLVICFCLVLGSKLVVLATNQVVKFLTKGARNVDNTKEV